MSSIRRGFALSPFIILLALAVIGLLVWKVTTQIGHIPAGHPMAAPLRSKFITTGVTTAVFAAALAGGVGAAGYFAFRRSERAANAGMIGVLLLFVGTFGFQAYNYLVNGPSARGGGTPTAANTPASSAPARAPVPQRPAPSPAASPAAQPPRPAPATSAAAPATPTPTPTPRPPAPPPPSRPTDDTEPAAKAALDPLKAEIQGALDQLIAAAEPLAQDLAKPPARHIGKMDEREQAVKALKKQAATIQPRLRELQNEAEAKLKDAGMADSDAMRHAIRFGHDFNGFRKAMACDAIVRLCDRASEEVEFLRANFDKWKPGRGGEVESKDLMVQGRARGLRAPIEMDVRAIDRELAELRGGER